MSTEWQYQIRIQLTEELAPIARNDLAHPALKPLAEVLVRHRAKIKCQYDAFADYVSEAERNGAQNYPLYKWTKATIENPIKKEKYLKSFTVYVDGAEVYSKREADALELDLKPMAENGLIRQISRHDTNPANNPQPPAHLR
ncbi:MAG TPA: hypothetical protein VE986_02505 [Hyphomicrobiales bacterium]|nr:hypothetical protein [Hyphomicrobiales bacterium]